MDSALFTIILARTATYLDGTESLARLAQLPIPYHPWQFTFVVRVEDIVGFRGKLEDARAKRKIRRTIDLKHVAVGNSENPVSILGKNRRQFKRKVS
jgi:hypothetical protein